MSESSLFLDRYQLLKRIGRGGSGDVWLARDLELEADVALKFLIDVYNEIETDILRRETKQARRLNHRHILPVYDFHLKQGEQAAISMEYAPGGSLAHQVSKEKPVLEVSELSDWMIQACEGFAYAHEEVGTVHRDIKPANLMLDRAGRLKIGDFGLSSGIAATLDSESKGIIGTRMTLHYASPQLIWNPTESHYLNDIYALGVTIFVLLTGTYPFRDPRENRWSWDPDRLLSMSDRREEKGYGTSPIPDSWNYAVARCLAEDPVHRPESMRALAVLLGANEYYDRNRHLSETHRTDPVTNETTALDTNPSSGGKFRRDGLLIMVFLILGILTGVLWGVFEMYRDRGASEDPEPLYEILPVAPGKNDRGTLEKGAQ